MPDLQKVAFGWAASQPLAIGLLVFGVGLVYAFFGFRIFRFLLVVTCASVGGLGGIVGARLAGLPPYIPGLVAAAVVGLVSLKWVRVGMMIASGTTWGLIGYYLANQFGLPLAGLLSFLAIATVLGALFAHLCRRTTPVVLTTLQGVVLLTVGFVAVSTQVVPTIGITFRQFASAQALVTPVLLAMLFTTGFSYQSTHHQGDILTGK